MTEKRKQEDLTREDATASTSDGDQRNDRKSSLHFTNFATASDEEFQNILREQLAENPLSKDYPDLFDKAPGCFVKWRRRYSKSPKLWKRIFQTDRVLKEFCEAVPVLDAVLKMMETDTRLQQEKQQYTIIDLCSGKGYLGMILSEMLPPSKVFRIVLMDKAWPMRNSPVKPQHINWEHIYGSIGEQNERQTDENGEEKNDSETTTKPESSSSRSYYDTWPIPIDTSKQDLKSSRQLQLIKKHYLSNPSQHPVILLAIHLCGTLSLRAIELFNTNPSVKFMALKPCCLPGMVHAKRHELFKVGTHCFEASEVCVHGKWNKDKWENGPPRSHLKPKFQKWSDHLYKGIGYEDSDANTTFGDDNKGDETVRKVHTKIVVQHGGGLQNDFLFAERMPVSSSNVWERLDQDALEQKD